MFVMKDQKAVSSASGIVSPVLICENHYFVLDVLWLALL